MRKSATRKLALLACAVIAAASLVGLSGAATPGSGSLDVVEGKGTVTIEIRGTVLGVLANGTVRVTDLTPRDRFYPVVLGRRLTITRPGPKVVVYKGKALRYRVLGGSSKLVIKGTGISASAKGRGYTILDGDRILPEDDAGVYTLDGQDCVVDVTLCVPLPDLPERYVIGTLKTTTRSFQPR
jgi:hypothetical protein